MFWTWPWHWGMGILGILFSILIVFIIIRIIFRIVHNEPWHRHHHHDWRGWDFWQGEEDSRSSARKILDERYAKGEIDDEEYKRKKENLK
jgi:putative membrane protein